MARKQPSAAKEGADKMKKKPAVSKSNKALVAQATFLAERRKLQEDAVAGTDYALR